AARDDRGVSCVHRVGDGGGAGGAVGRAGDPGAGDDLVVEHHDHVVVTVRGAVNDLGGEESAVRVGGQVHVASSGDDRAGEDRRVADLLMRAGGDDAVHDVVDAIIVVG